MTLAIAVIFPGQGSQKLGMLSDSAARHPEIREYFQQASDILNYDLWQLIQDDPNGLLNETEFTQPALFVSSYALYQMYISHVVSSEQKRLFAGHSLGEYSALACSQAIKFSDTVKLVALRGRLMQQAVPKGIGAMAAIVGLADEVITQICQESSCDNYTVSPANYNSIGQVVISGHFEAVEKAISLAKASKAKIAKHLPLSVPSHSPLMNSIVSEFQNYLAKVEIALPEFSVVSNVDALPYQSAESIREKLAMQLCHPVQWVNTVHYLSHHCEQFVECGPGNVLSGLIKRINKSAQQVSVEYLLCQ